MAKAKPELAKEPGDLVVPPGMKAVHTVSFSPSANEADQATADFWLNPATAAVGVIEPFSKHAMPGINSDALAKNLRESMNAETYKDQSMAMLFGQAMALQSIFVELARSGKKQEMLKQHEAHMRLALKAQNQCRMTLETLAAVQNPPVVFAKQANINNGGQQQVNNGTPPPPDTHTAKPVSEQNELLELDHGQRLDARAAGTTSGTDPELVPLAEVHRPEVGRGKVQGRTQRRQGRNMAERA